MLLAKVLFEMALSHLRPCEMEYRPFTTAFGTTSHLMLNRHRRNL